MNMMLPSNFSQTPFKPLDRALDKPMPAGRGDSGRAFEDKLSECCRGKEDYRAPEQADSRPDKNSAEPRQGRSEDSPKSEKEAKEAVDQTDEKAVDQAGEESTEDSGTDDAKSYNMSLSPMPFLIQLLAQNGGSKVSEQGAQSAAQVALTEGDLASLSKGKEAKGGVVPTASGKIQPENGAPSNSVNPAVSAKNAVSKEAALATPQKSLPNSPAEGAQAKSTLSPADPAVQIAKNATSKEGAVATQQKSLSNLPGDAAQARSVSNPADPAVQIAKNASSKEAAVLTQQKPLSSAELPEKSVQNPANRRESGDLSAARNVDPNAAAKSAPDRASASQGHPAAVTQTQTQLPAQALAQMNQAHAPSVNTDSVRMQPTGSAASSSGGEGDKQRGDSNQSSSLLGSSQLKLDASAAQKSENIRVFISRMDSALQQMRQENTSNVQLRLNLEQGQVIKIRLSLRGTKLKTVIHSENENVRNILRASWSDVSKVLGEKGVEAENPEFESSSNDTLNQGESFEEKAESAFAKAGLARGQGESEGSDETSAQGILPSVTETQFFQRIA